MPKERKPTKQKIGVVTASALNVRPEPSTKNPPIGQLKRGTIVNVLQQINSWYKIHTERIEGFVYGDYVRIQDDTPASGYLFELEDLRAISLEPPVNERIDTKPGFSRRQKVVAHTWNRLGGLLKALSDIIEVDTTAAVAVLCVESRGRGFGPDGRMIIRFENHVFWRQWGKNNQGVFDAHFRFDPVRRWTNHEFRENPDGSWNRFHGKQKQEWDVFEVARVLNEPAAMRSISMGAPQIMGFNHPRVGYDSVKGMFDAFQSEIRYQILGLFDFLKGSGATSPMIEALQRKRFEIFASYYNGQGQAARYGELIEERFDIFNALRAAA
jgi:hypothetical protein